MNDGRAAPSVAHRAGVGVARIARAWRVLPHERRLAAFASIGLFLTLFLPWYQETVIVPGGKSLQSKGISLTGWSAFSFVEAAVLLVAAGILTLLFQRAEGRPFHLPGGDGWVIMAAGFWTCVLVVWRIFDKQGTSSHAQLATTSGIEWGIFIALAVAAFLAYSGSRIRAAHRPEPPLPGEPAVGEWDPSGSSSPASPAPRRPVRPPPPVPADDPPTIRTERSSAPAVSARRPPRPDDQLTIPLEGESRLDRSRELGDERRLGDDRPLEDDRERN